MDPNIFNVDNNNSENVDYNSETDDYNGENVVNNIEDGDVRATLNNVLGIEGNESLLSNVGEDEDEDSEDFNGGGPDTYLDSEDEGLNLVHVEEEVNTPGHFEEYEEDPLTDEYEHEHDVTDEDEARGGMNKERFTHEQFLQGPIEGMTFGSKDSMSRKEKQKKSSKRIECKARVNAIMMVDGSSWRVTRVESEHNHVLDARLSRFMPSHREMSRRLKRQLVAHDIAGLRPSKSIRVLEVEAGGPENLGCTPKDLQNYILRERRLRTLSTVEASNKRFFDMQIKDREFFYAVDHNNSGRRRNCVWFHTHSKYAYLEFCDMICFDTTYLVNQWHMPFASFIRVNQHRQSILLGCALITSEDANTNKYVFSTWLRAMNGVAPTAIMTDQCESIKAAIRVVMPNAIHRYCIWHIFTKLPFRLKRVHNAKIAKREFKAVIFDSITIDEFFGKWEAFIQKYELQNRRWFSNLFLEREKWVPVYLKHYFWAGMLSTQRCEGMHAFFDGYISGSSTLKQFVEEYEIALRVKFDKELTSEYNSRYTEAKVSSGFMWEEQIQTHYTRTIYDLFMDQLAKKYHCEISNHEDAEVVEGVEKFDVADYSIKNDFHGNVFVFLVEYRTNGEYLECNCKHFESTYILCCHILEVMSRKRIDIIPDRYIIRRWRRDVVRPHLRKFFPGSYLTMTDEFKRYYMLKKWFDRVCDVALDSEVKIRDFKNVMKARLTAYLDWDDDMLVPDVGGDDSYDDNFTYIRNTRETRPCGRPPINRRRGGRENVFRQGDGPGYRARCAPNANENNENGGDHDNAVDNNGGTCYTLF
ncbi:protein FAR1-RELATED SEQUENCE 6-like [Lycium ferocissimum]|uniref:protein FAR1-RELATED SEQUENCE 6-like n=1 Tax=Lycium ferocissimum TaxID=112874 RepID=UPI0028155016|nr:protein FAR1-RELATED SEQUENCE 6-like [Lycium ferocissimum]